MQQMLEFSSVLYFPLELLFHEKSNHVDVSFLSIIVFAAYFWFLFSVPAWFLLVCVPKVIFLPPTPTGTFPPRSPRFSRNPAMPFTSCICLTECACLLKELLAEIKLSVCQKAQADFGAQLWGRGGRKDWVGALTPLPLLCVNHCLSKSFHPF